MPSLHVGFAFAVGMVLAASFRNPVAKLIAHLWGPAIALAVVATGNHYVFDIVAGMVAAALGYGIGAAVARRGPAEHEREQGPDDGQHRARADEERRQALGRARRCRRRSRSSPRAPRRPAPTEAGANGTSLPLPWANRTSSSTAGVTGSAKAARKQASAPILQRAAGELPGQHLPRVGARASAAARSRAPARRRRGGRRRAARPARRPRGPCGRRRRAIRSAASTAATAPASATGGAPRSGPTPSASAAASTARPTTARRRPRRRASRPGPGSPCPRAGGGAGARARRRRRGRTRAAGARAGHPRADRVAPAQPRVVARGRAHQRVPAAPAGDLVEQVEDHPEHDPPGGGARHRPGKVGEHAFQGGRRVGGCVPHRQAMVPLRSGAQPRRDPARSGSSCYSRVSR